MIWLFSIPVIIFLTFSELIKSDWDSMSGGHRGFLGWCMTILLGSVLSAIISFVPIGVAAIIGSIPEVHGVKDGEYPLIALREKDGFKGQFYFLGAGSISDRQYYFWYRQNPNGSISGGRTPRESGVEVYEYDGDPIMITYRTEYKSKLAGRYIWIIGLDTRSKDNWYPRFYIPKGSIKEGFSL